MNLSRRKFIKVTTIISATTIPVAGILAEEFNDELIAKKIDEAFNTALEFHVIDNNLLNLHFYFINVKRKRKYLIPDVAGNSFMIVRLPQMHVSEKGYWENDWKDAKKRYPDAKLSGYSYLAFQFWPERKDKKGDVIYVQKKLEFNLENILNWNDETNFDLITLVEWFNLKNKNINDFEFANYSTGDCEAFENKKTFKIADNIATLTSKEPKSEIYKKYKSIINKFLDGNLKQSDSNDIFVPASFLEAPQALCLIPITRDSEGNLIKLKKQFWKNKYVNQQEVTEGYRKYEVYNNSLFYKIDDKSNNNKTENTFTIKAPSFRAIGIITNEKLPCSTSFKCEDQTAGERNTLPTLLDKTELAFLTQFAKDPANCKTNDSQCRDFTQKDFDINELNGLFFTGLGIITHLKYYNVDKKPACIDLIEYEHTITQGRDIFIKVARLGYNVKTGQKYKHVIEGKRKIETEILDSVGKVIYTFPKGATSFIELKQYCECIEKEFVYNEFPDKFDNPSDSDSNGKPIWHWEDEMQKSPSGLISGLMFEKMSEFGVISNDIIAPALDDNLIHNYRRFPYTSLIINEKNRVPISCLQNNIIVDEICILENDVKWFWPILEQGAIGSDTDISLNSYLNCEYEAKDWENKSIKAKTPFMFIRASLLECTSNNDSCNPLYNGPYIVSGDLKAAFANYFKGEIKDGIVKDGDQIFFDRRKTYLNNQLVALGPSLKDENSKDNDPSRSKVNIIETEFIDTYFVIRSPVYDKNCLPSQKIKYIVFPQLLRFQGYTDHIRDYTNKKIPQVLEHHENYIACKYNSDKDFKNPNTKEIIRNYGTLLFANTDAFIGNTTKPIARSINGAIRPVVAVEEKANQKYGDIKQALQEVKDKLGNLVVPDIVPDTISLEKFGITVPKEINDSIKNGTTVIDKAQTAQTLLNKISSFNPRELLRGKLSDVCGLDLTSILDELIPANTDKNQTNQTPLFEINKIINQISDEIKSSSVYNEIQKEIEAVKSQIQTLEEGYQSLATIINSKEQDLVNNLKKLSNLIPNTDELNNLLKSLFEKYRTEVFDLVLSDFSFEDTLQKVVYTKTKVEGFFANEKQLLNDEYLAKRTQLQNYFDSVRNEMSNLLPVELQYIETYIHNNLNSLYQTDFCDYPKKIDALYESCITVDLKQLPNVYYKVNGSEINWELSNNVLDKPLQVCKITFDATNVNIPVNIGFVQYKSLINYLQTFIIKNVNGNDIQKNAVSQIQTYLNNELDKTVEVGTNSFKVSTLFENYVQSFQNDSMIGLSSIKDKISDWKQASDSIINSNIDSSIQTAVRKVQGVVLKLLDYVDFLKKVDPYYYYADQVRLNKEIIDIKAKFQQTFYDLYTNIEKDIFTIFLDYDTAKNDYILLIQGLEKAKQQLLQVPPQISVEEYNKILQNFNESKNKLGIIKRGIVDKVSEQAKTITSGYINSLKENSQLKVIYKAIYGDESHTGLIEDIITQKNDYKLAYQSYVDYVKAEGNKAQQGITDKIQNYIEDQEDKLIHTIGADNILAVQQNINEAKNIYKLLTSIKQQDLTYNWSTDRFRDINLGIVSFKKFSNPDTTLNVNVKATTYFTSGKFPPAIERVTTYSENRFTNFGISFFNSLTIGFSEISFIAGSDQSTHFDVKIKDVKFDGALSFVQAFQSWLQTIGKGLILQLEADHVALGYSLAIPSIKTPGFNIFNLSLNFDLRVYFDKRPLRFGFSLARVDSKFGIAVGIYAGFGFFGIVADPKNGIVEIDCALEAGAWAGISIGPISGEVKLAFGFRYTKNELGVRIEGYIVAEGRLSVWILEVAARIYLGVVSENSYIEGVCTVSYSVKLGFVSKSFSGSFHKKIAGANSNNAGGSTETVAAFHKDFARKAGIAIPDYNHFKNQIGSILSHYNEIGDDILETEPVSSEAWEKFITVF
ncbi:MAG: hypothetical protein M3Z26_09300 [Bacteroidota bacterium]|nr:hypothetical protein [Bacteroidota bacterium]